MKCSNTVKRFITTDKHFFWISIMWVKVKCEDKNLSIELRKNGLEKVSG